MMFIMTIIINRQAGTREYMQHNHALAGLKVREMVQAQEDNIDHDDGDDDDDDDDNRTTIINDDEEAKEEGVQRGLRCCCACVFYMFSLCVCACCCC